jgi:hypothetical protein
MERDRTLGAHGRRPRCRCWGIDGGDRPALPAEEFLRARDIGPDGRAMIANVPNRASGLPTTLAALIDGMTERALRGAADRDQHRAAAKAAGEGGLRHDRHFPCPTISSCR